MKKLVARCSLLVFKILFASVFLSIPYTLYPIPLLHAQSFNTASTYEIADKEARSGDILVNSGEKGLNRTNITYDNKIFGVLDNFPTIVLKEASGSAEKKAVIRSGDTDVNVTDYNGEIKKGDYITTSPVLGKGMKAGQSGYVLGIALEDAKFGQETQNVDGKQVKSAVIKTALQIEYAELSTARNNFALLNQLNTAFFRSVQNPEKFTLTIRYIMGGLVALIAFAIGFFTVARSISKAVEAVGRNPLAKNTIMASVVLQIILTVVGAIATVAIVYVIIRV